MKKIILSIIIAIIIVFTFKHYYISNKCTDITYVCEKYLTTGILNKNKLYSTDDFCKIFSDGTTSIVKVTGTQTRSPHKKVTYKLLLEKNKKGLWKVIKIYPQSN